eukprot:TRINITY_DN8706_c0_g1_i1.p1 TRINITY_DN8706_c0_g1~~TRINITY_DN8706_c0_g1_i1.p1  ORF type:complete len:339 (-),score=132.13 TRINITY_DN8706_c0_g1_i1:322-1338(-)
MAWKGKQAWKQEEWQQAPSAKAPPENSRELSRMSIKQQDLEAQIKSCRKSLEAAQRKNKGAIVSSLQAKLDKLLAQGDPTTQPKQPKEAGGAAAGEAKKGSKKRKKDAAGSTGVEESPAAPKKKALKKKKASAAGSSTPAAAKQDAGGDDSDESGDEAGAVALLLKAAKARQAAADTSDDEDAIDLAGDWRHDPELKAMMAKHGASWDDAGDGGEDGEEEDLDEDVPVCATEEATVAVAPPKAKVSKGKTKQKQGSMQGPAAKAGTADADADDASDFFDTAESGNEDESPPVGAGQSRPSVETSRVSKTGDSSAAKKGPGTSLRAQKRLRRRERDLVG